MRMRFSLVILALLVSLSLYSQSTISGTFSGNDLGVGVRYDQQITRNQNTNHGLYVHAGYGCYRDIYIGKVEHYRASIGYEVILRNYASKDLLQVFTFGINGHEYNHFEEGITELDHGINHVSIEFGFGVIICKRLVWNVNYDPIKKDVVAAIGYRFGIYER
jgi:hypothetical protein